jgi:hypothetical protein
MIIICEEFRNTISNCFYVTKTAIKYIVEKEHFS